MSNKPAETRSEGRLRHGGKVLADQLALLGVDRIFCVPGESYLGLLDGLHDHRDSISVITCRHESGAAIMADAHAKLTGRPGICAVTRGPGATNASNGVHVAYQDSTPMIVLIGQVGRDMLDREAFQEIDYRRMYGQLCKWVAQIDDAGRIPEYLSHAWHVAQSGRPGPVALALPEDILSIEVDTPDLRPSPIASSAPTSDALERLGEMLARAERPLMVVGGGGWSADCALIAQAFSERTGLPVTTSFRCQDYFDNRHENFVGVLGIAPNPKLVEIVRRDCDLLIAVGPRLGEITTQGYSLVDIPNPQMALVHVHAGPEEPGSVYAADLPIAAPAAQFLAAIDKLPAGNGTQRWMSWLAGLRALRDEFFQPPQAAGKLDMGRVIRHLDDSIGDDAIIANGAGNYSVWLHRYLRYRGYRSQLAPTNGSMGYGVPASIAAKLAAPEREVFCVAGDGCFMMTAQELATAAHYDAKVVFLVINNGMYGTIRMHQERHYPARVQSTALTNPDFVAFARAFGFEGECVETTEAFPEALDRARRSRSAYLIELVIDPEDLTPTMSLTEIREKARGQVG